MILEKFKREKKRKIKSTEQNGSEVHVIRKENVTECTVLTG